MNRSQPLFQINEICTKIDMERDAIKNQRRHGFHSRLLSLLKAIFVFSKVDNLHRVFAFVDGLCHLLFGFDANRTTGMIEYSFAHFVIPIFGFRQSGSSRLKAIGYAMIQEADRGHFLVGRALFSVKHW